MDWTEFGFWLKKIVSGLVLLPASPMIVAAFGLALRRRRRVFGNLLVTIGATVLVVFSLPLVANALASRDERLYPPLDPTVAMPTRAAIVVLSGGVQPGAIDYGGETINATTLARLRSAAHLAARTGLPILVTGGRLPPSERSEAAQMADVMDRDFHMPVRWIEDRSLDTADNGRMSAPLLKSDGIDTAVLVTDVAHMRRAKIAFEAAGLQVVAAPTDYYASAPITVLSFIPNTNALRRSNWTLHEWLGAWWMRWRQ